MLLGEDYLLYDLCAFSILFDLGQHVAFAL